jgi:hypothetical protein
MSLSLPSILRILELKIRTATADSIPDIEIINDSDIGSDINIDFQMDGK